MREALLYDQILDSRVCCNLCAHRCIIPAGHKGLCKVRKNNDGLLYTLVYGRTITQNADPVEKKPLFHFQPGTTTYSIATPGCNVHCQFCQNWYISQMARTEKDIQGQGVTASPGDIVSDALRSGCSSIAYTYTEPTIFFEYAYDTARLAHRHGLANIFVSNGYQTAETLEMLQPYMDAINVDLKAFSDRFYRKMIGARLQPVLDTLKRIKQMNIWVEVTTLVIPNLNDREDELRAIARFISTELGSDTPWHVSRFYPTYKLTTHPPTPVQTVQRAREIGREEGLHYVYEGNIPGGDGEHTYCSNCNALLIGRYGFHVYSNHIEDGECPQCHTVIEGIGMSRAVAV